MMMHDLARLACTYVGVARSSTGCIATLNKGRRLNLDSEISGMIAGSIHRLVDAIPSPLESQALSPLICNVIPHRMPNIRDVGASVHPGRSRVWRDY